MNAELKEAYNRCKPEEALDWNDQRYVPFDSLGLRGGDASCVEAILSTITMSNDVTRQLFSGFRGSGKTTELKRLQKKLEEDRYEVIYVDSEKYLNLNVPTSATDILVAIAAGVDHHLGRRLPEQDLVPFRRFWDRFRTFLSTEVSFNGLPSTCRRSGAMCRSRVTWTSSRSSTRHWRAGNPSW